MVCVAFAGCDGGRPSSTPGSPASDPPSAFSAERAFADLRDLVAIGPRAAGSQGAAAARELIRTRLRQAGWAVEDHEFSAPSLGGEPVPMVNLIATLAGSDPQTLLLGTHYDTKRFDGRFVGANDGASGVAVLLETARLLGRSRPRHTLRLLFFDGEEAFGPSISATDGLYGSQALAEKMLQEGELAKTRALVLIDMVGDRDLNLAIDENSALDLVELYLEEGKDLVDPTQTFALIDDHIPFRQRGLEQVLALIDFQYGSRQSPGPLWHTSADDLSAVSAQSLNRVGELLVRLIARLESESAAQRSSRSARGRRGGYAQAHSTNTEP